MVASPGPSVIPDRVLAAMAKPMPDLYGEHIQDVYRVAVDGLAPIVGSAIDPFMVIGNGHAAWQMTIANTMSRGDKVLVLESGLFAVAWGEMAAVSGVDVEVLYAKPNRAVDSAAVAERLAADPNHDISAVLMVQTDTALSVCNDVKAVRDAMDQVGHPALLMVDCIASLGCDRYYMDDWGVDVTVAACQKGLMVPPGLAFVWASPRAYAAYESADLRTSYFDWGQRRNAEAFYQLFGGTPPISHLYALAEATKLIAEEGGIEAVWQRHKALAAVTHAAVDAWSTPGAIEMAVARPQERSAAVTTILAGSIDTDRINEICRLGAGLSLGLGIGEFSGRAFRIGHMGHLNPPMLLGTLGTVEAALISIGAPIGGSGVEAASATLSGYMPIEGSG